MREGKIESGHFIKSQEGMGSRSCNLGTELRMHSLTEDCNTFSNEETDAAVVPVASAEVEVTGSEAMVALSFSTLLQSVIRQINNKVEKLRARIASWEGQH